MSSSVLGGPYNGFSTVQTTKGYRDTEIVNIRNVLKNSWNKAYTQPSINGHGRITTPFRAVNNSGDYLGRVNYSCGGSNQINATYPEWRRLIGTIPQNCDGTGIPASICNTKFVEDSSEYTKFRKQRSINRNYNDLKDGGYTNSAYVNILAAKRGF